MSTFRTARIAAARAWSFHGVMQAPDFEEIAEAAYLRIGRDPSQPVSPLTLAGELLGWETLVEVDALEAPVVTRGGRLLVRRGLTPGVRSWHVARELARLLIVTAGDVPTEAATDSLAACLRTPRRAFEPFALAAGPAFVGLAGAFLLSESAAALRFGEVTGSALALFAPGRPVRMRGKLPKKAVVRVIRLRDAPGRHVRLYAA